MAITLVLSLLTTAAFAYWQLTVSSIQSNISPKIIRFQKPEEIKLGEYGYRTNFTWTPENPTDNCILSMYCYVETRCERPDDPVWTREDPHFEFSLFSSISVGYFSSPTYSMGGNTRSLEDWDRRGFSNWKLLFYRVGDSERLGENRVYWITPNQNNYLIELLISANTRGYGREEGWYSAPTPTYIKNINVIMEVVDG